MTTVTTREQWILAKQMSSAISNLNAPFCDSGPAEGPNKEWLEPISEMIAEGTSVFALEDAIPVLERALEIAIKNSGIK
jgi:hypothetical protein